MTGKLLSKIYGGINANATRLNIAENEAESIVNWDIGLDGAITRRLGCSLKATLGTPFCHLGKFNKTDGTEVFVAVAANKVWRSTDLVNWSDVTGSVSLTASSGYVGASQRDRYFITNGADSPVYLAASGNATTMEAASVISPPTNLAFNKYGAAGAATLVYAVTALTPRGETACSGTVTVGSSQAANNLTATNYNAIAWTPTAGATKHRVYCACTSGTQQRYINYVLNPSGTITLPQGSWGLIGEVDGTTGAFTDASPVFVCNAANLAIYPPTANTAYLTPGDWNTNGQPQGFALIARGRDERMLAWRGNTIWASGLSDALNWLTVNDAFIWTVNAARDNRISAIGNLHDYTIVFTRTDSYLYTGASAGDINLEKVVPVGCYSPGSIVPVGDDLYFCSQYGPTTMKRIVQGADVANTTNFNNRIQPLFFATNRAYWDRICGYVMPQNNRVVWWIAGAGQTSNTFGLVFQYDIGAWTSYDTWTPISVVSDALGNLYGGFADGNVYQIHTGYSDNGAAITATYKTGHMDLTNWEPRKRIPWVDVIGDRSNGAYTFSVSWGFDMGRETAGPVTCTETTTDGSSVVYTSNTTTQHRVFTHGIGNTVQLTFNANTAGQAVKILGYGTEIRPLGKR